MNVIGWLIVGLLAGAIARLLVPGRDPIGCLGTLAVGLAGSLVGGFLGDLLFGRDDGFSPAGLLGSILGAMIVLVVLRALARPRRPSSRGPW